MSDEPVPLEDMINCRADWGYSVHFTRRGDEQMWASLRGEHGKVIARGAGFEPYEAMLNLEKEILNQRERAKAQRFERTNP